MSGGQWLGIGWATWRPPPPFQCIAAQHVWSPLPTPRGLGPGTEANRPYPLCVCRAREAALAVQIRPARGSALRPR